MIDIQSFSLVGTALCLLLFVMCYYLVERLNDKLLAILGLKEKQLNLLLRKVIMVVFSLGGYLLLNLEIKEIFSLSNLRLGLTWVAVGVGIAFLVAILTFKIVRETNYGEKFILLLNKSPILVLITTAIFVGPAEDILFLGIIQNTLTRKIGWGAILVYVITFTFFHYLNVFSNIESKKEFWGMFPIRLTISLVLAIAYYQTKSLIYSLIIHNLFDSINYLAMLVGANKKSHLKLNN